MSKTVTLYIRHGCHLCEAFIEELAAYQQLWQFEVEQVDIDTDPELVTSYGTRVPVMTIDGREICQYFLDPDSLKTYFEQG